MNKENWGDGPWQNEPDDLRFEHLGFLCILKRIPLHGCWCGYVRIPDLHPWFTDDLDTSNILVHGGITFTGHLPGEPKEECYIFVGFDCAHGGDLSPTWSRGPFEGRGTYKDIKYATQEIKSLASQACEAGVLVYTNNQRRVLSLGLDITYRPFENLLYQEFMKDVQTDIFGNTLI